MPSNNERAYFRNALNYTLGDEDSTVEFRVLELGARQVVSVASSGTRVMPLLAKHPENLVCVDISPPQLWITELRIEAARRLSHSDYLAFFGYPSSDSRSLDGKEVLRELELSDQARAFFNAFFDDPSRGQLIYEGRFENMLITLSKINRFFTGKKGLQVFEARNLREQEVYLREEFPELAWKIVLRILGNASTLNVLLYKGNLPKKNIPGSSYAFYRRAFARLFANTLARECAFLQMVFFGKLRFLEGNPIECELEVFARIKEALKHTRVSYWQGDVISLVASMQDQVDFLSLSDVPTFLQEEKERTFLQDIRPGLCRNALVVTRGHLRVPNPDTSGYVLLDETYEDPLRREKTQLWHINIYKAIG